MWNREKHQPYVQNIKLRVRVSGALVLPCNSFVPEKQIMCDVWTCNSYTEVMEIKTGLLFERNRNRRGRDVLTVVTLGWVRGVILERKTDSGVDRQLIPQTSYITHELLYTLSQPCTLLHETKWECEPSKTPSCQCIMLINTQCSLTRRKRNDKTLILHLKRTR